MKKLLFFGFLLFLMKTAHSQITFIPDQNFEQALINQGIDSDNTLNGQVLTADISSRSVVNLSNSNISDLTGIEDFTGTLNLNVSNNQLTTIDVSALSALFSLNVDNNQLTSINFGGLLGISILSCRNNALTSLDVSGITGLENLDFANNQIASIELPVNTSRFEQLVCFQNPIERIDVTPYTNFNGLFAQDCDLFEVKINTAAQFLFVTGNTDLNCIEVDNVAQASANTNWSKDSFASYSLNCPALTKIPDSNFEQALINQGIDTDNTINGFVATSDISGITSLNVSNESISDFRGLEDFSSLLNLDVSDNQHTILDLSSLNNTLQTVNSVFCSNFSTAILGANSNLTSVNFGATQLTSLDVTTVPNLQSLNISGTQITNIDLSNLQQLQSLGASNSPITSLNLNGLTNLTSIDAGNMTSLAGPLDLSKNNALTTFFVSNSLLTSIDLRNGNNSNISLMNVSNNTNLGCIAVDDPNNIPGAWQKDATASYSASCIPTVQVLTFPTTITQAGQTTIDIVFSEPVNGFTQSDIVTSNTTIANFVGAQGSTSYAVVIDISQSVVCDGLTVEVTVPAGVATSVSSGLANTAGSASGVGVDANTPTFVTQDVIAQLDSNGQVSIAPEDFDNGSTDNCTAASDLVFTTVQNTTNLDCTDIGAHMIMLVITDAVGNAVGGSVNLTVVDDLPPNLQVQDATLQLDANGGATLQQSDVVVSATDNCSVASTTLSKTSFDCSNVGQNEVVVTVTDGSGNTTNLSATVTIEDAVFPNVITQNATIQLNASGQATITSTIIDGGSSDNCGLASVVPSKTSFTCSDLGTNTVTLTVTDVNGNVSTDTAVVTVEDNQPLTAIAQDITVQIDANGQATITPQDVDNGSGSGCNGNPTLSLDITSFDCSDIGNPVTVTLTATEGGNSVTDTAVVTVEDDIPPTVITQDLTLQLNNNGLVGLNVGDVNNGSADNCTGGTISINKSSFTCADVGQNTVTLTFTDASGNISTGDAIITVEDNIAPNTLAQDITVQLNASGQASITPNDIDAGSSDNCAIDTLSLDKTDFTCSDLGQNTVTLTVTDVNGNANTATATVTVEEDPNQPLVAIAQDITVSLGSDGTVSIAPSDVDNGSGSGCNSSPTLSLDITSFDCSDLGTNTVILTSTEGSDSDSATATITIVDDLAPAVVAQDISVVLDANGQASIVASDIDNGSSDNCTASSDLVLALDSTAFNCTDLGTNTVILTVTDVEGNSASTSATVTVTEDVAPTVITQDITITLDSDGNASVDPGDIDNGSFDDCSGVADLSINALDLVCPVLGDIIVTLTVLDGAGNSASGTAIVTITATDDDNNGIADACENQELVVSKGFSPNGDNNNDTWVVENIEDYPNGVVSVFNRWGELVYRRVGYQNDWDAVSNQIGTEKKLPVGSYLYVIETNDPEVPPVQGWMYINY